MKCIYSTILTALFVIVSSLSANSQSTDPINLKADVTGIRVDLSWSRAVVGQAIQSNGFETSEFPGEGWSVKTTNSSDYKCSWFKYPTAEISENLEGWEELIYNGEATAVVMGDQGSHDGVLPYIQDEWLISPEVSGAAYLDFYCYIHPMIREYGQYEAFPDHYYVKVSYDGGTTWEVLWDARYDSGLLVEWQQVSLPLNKDKKAIVAFEAIGNQNKSMDEGLYFTWAIDDVMISNSEAASNVARANMQAKSRTDIPVEKSYREFMPSTDTKAVSPAKAPQQNAAVDYYNVYLDGVLLASYLKSLNYADVTEKSAGEYVYKVTHVDAASGTESAGAELRVKIEDMKTNPPTNLRVNYVYVESGDSYTIDVAWDEPEGDRKPSCYNVYRGEEQIAYLVEDLYIEQTEVPRGIYTYSVSAVYEYPDGSSPKISKSIAIDAYFPVRNLAYKLDGANVVLNWQVPIADETQAFASYSVFRGNTCLSDDLTETSYTDYNSPNGVYDYSVVVNYASGKKSEREYVTVSHGGAQIYSLPINENFDGGMTPANWVVFTSNDTNVKYRWRFDNFFGLSLGGGFSGDFASINSIKSGYNVLDCELRTPRFDTNLEEGEQLYVEFDLNYLSNSGKSALLLCSVDGGFTWYEVCMLPSYGNSQLGQGETCKPQKVSYELTKFVSSEPMMLCWYYTAFHDGHLSIDNVSIYAGDKAGVEGVELDNINAPVEYFNLQGIPAENPENGVYIMRQGSKVTKIVK